MPWYSAGTIATMNTHRDQLGTRPDGEAGLLNEAGEEESVTFDRPLSWDDDRYNAFAYGTGEGQPDQHSPR